MHCLVTNASLCFVPAGSGGVWLVLVLGGLTAGEMQRKQERRG